MVQTREARNGNNVDEKKNGGKKDGNFLVKDKGKERSLKTGYIKRDREQDREQDKDRPGGAWL